MKEVRLQIFIPLPPKILGVYVKRRIGMKQVCSVLLTTSVAVALASSCCNAFASNGTDVEIETLRIVVPDVSEWTRISKGILQGVSEDGSYVRVYLNEGMESYLANLERELHFAKWEVSTASADEIERKEANVAAIREELEGHRRILGGTHREKDPVRSKASQSYEWSGSEVCHLMPLGGSTFIADNSHWIDYPIAQADFAPLGDGPQFGPLFPGNPSQALRSVRATVEGASTTDLDYTNSRNLNVEQWGMVFSGHCAMETRHAISATCWDNSQSAWAIVRTQTCAGVLGGTPAYEVHDPNPTVP